MFTKNNLKKIYDKTTGKCHLCHKKLSFNNYGQIGAKGAWEIEHSVPRAKGGTDHLNNLYPSCISCNRTKGKRSTRSIRAQNGVVKAPLSKINREKAKTATTLTSGLVGGVLGAATGGPIGALIGAVIGASIGNNSNPDKAA